MKYRHITSFFAVAAVAVVALRLFQMVYVIDHTTGFADAYNETENLLVMIFMLALIAVATTFAVFALRKPIKMPTVNPLLSICSLGLGASIFYELHTATYAMRIPAWQIALLDALGLIAAIFFAVYALKVLFNFRISGLFFALPVLYGIVELIYIFTSISEITMISDNLLLLITKCATLVFLLQMAKAANGLSTVNSYKVLLSTGIAAALLSFATAIGPLLAPFADKTLLELHKPVCSYITITVMGLFITVFVFSCFSEKNLFAKKDAK